MYRAFFKRFLDIILSITLLGILSPLFLITAVILFFIQGSVFFTQLRPGLHGKIFRIYKFKSMSDRKDKDGKLLPDVQRMTKFGRFIRKASIDEIPQLINVLIGDMSLVGPRPLLVEYLPLYNEHQSKRHLVRPGITGWAQVKGRNAISWTQKFNLDVWYVEHVSFFTDIRILWLTVKKVIQSEGISASAHVTMERFVGN